MKIFLFLGTVVWSVLALHVTLCGACPPRCTCTSIKNKASKDSTQTPRVGQGRKVICLGTYSPISHVAEIRNLPLDTVILDLSKNTITVLHRGEFNRLSGLKRLNLSNNQITIIEPNVFEGLGNLEKLDMSYNKIGSINSSIFTGLPKLQRLILSYNKINTIPEGTFNPLLSLRKIEFTSEYLRCDCHLQWIVKWSREKNVKIQSSTTCAVPSELKKTPLRKLKKEDLHCNRPLELPLFEIFPSKSQVVFEGDKLPFECRASVIDRNTKMVWIRKDEVVETNREKGIFVHTSRSRDQSIMIHHLVLEELSEKDSGIWQCKVTSPQGNVTSDIDIVVIPTTASYCPSFTTTTNKGVYKWPRTVAGVKSEQPCKIGEKKTASHSCSTAGLWEKLNVDQCEYTDEVLRGLKTLGSKYNDNADDLLLRAAELQNLTSVPAINRAAYFMVATGAIESLALHIPTREEIAERVLKIISDMINLNKAVLRQGQLEDKACTRLVNVVESIPGQLGSKTKSLHSQNIGLYVMQLTAGQYKGITCVVSSSFWMNVGCQQGIENITAKNYFARLGSMLLPRSLINNTEIGESESVTFQLVSYKEPALFPVTTQSFQDPLLHGKQLVPASGVLSINLSFSVHDLTEPVVLTFKVKTKSNHLYAAYWNFTANEGNGEWSTEGCHIYSVTNGTAVVHCYHLSSFIVLEAKDSDDLGLPKMLHLMKPAVYVGSCVCILCLMAVIVTYVSCFRFINVPKKMKHSVINICISSLLLIITFTMGVKRIDHHLACQIVGISIHYLTLCAMFWVTITAYNLLKKFTKADKPPAPPPDPVSMPLPPKPMLRFYLLGYGVPIIVCGITAAVSLDHYAEPNYCFLQWDPSLGAFYGPVALLVLFDVVFFLRIACVIQVTKSDAVDVITDIDETNDIELNHPTDEITTEIEALTPSRPAQAKDMSDTQSSVSSVMDQERKPSSQLYSVVGILLLYILFWVCGAVTVAEPFKTWIPHQELIFSYLYAFTCALFGIFMLAYFCLSRNDSCSSWKRFFLCDQPSVYDMNFHVPNHLDVPNGNISKGTGESSVPLNHYNITQEDNDKSFKDKSLVSLVPVNSVTDGSVVSVPENSAYFYNPKQNGAAKRFWEKRHHSKLITKDMFKNFSGSGTDYFSGSEAGRPAVKSVNLSDTNTHLSIEIQIQPKNGINSKPTSPVNFSPGLYCQPIQPPNGMPYHAPYFSLLPLHRNHIPPVGGSNVGSNIGCSSPAPGSQCCSVTSYPESQSQSHNRCPSSCSLGTKSHPSAFTPVPPRNNTLPKHGKSEVTCSPVPDMQRNGSVPRLRDFDGQSQISENCANEQQRMLQSGGSHNCNNNKMHPPSYRECTYRQYGSVDDNITENQKPLKLQRSMSGGSDSSGRHYRTNNSFIQEVHQRIPCDQTKQNSVSPPSYQTPNRDLLSPNTRTQNGVLISPDSDSQLQLRKLRGHDSDHNSEPASQHSSHRKHHRRDHHHKRHSRHRGLPKPRSLDWDQQQSKAIPYVYVNHSYSERVKEKLKTRGIDRQTKSSNSINHYPEYGPMMEDSSSTSSDDDEFYPHDVWVLQGGKPKKSKKETSV